MSIPGTLTLRHRLALHSRRKVLSQAIQITRYEPDTQMLAAQTTDRRIHDPHRYTEDRDAQPRRRRDVHHDDAGGQQACDDPQLAPKFMAGGSVRKKRSDKDPQDK